MFTTEAPTDGDGDGCPVLADCAGYAPRVGGLAKCGATAAAPHAADRPFPTGYRPSLACPVGQLPARQVRSRSGHPVAGNLDWTAEQAVAPLEAGYPADRLTDRTGSDLRRVKAQQRRLAAR